MTDTGATDPFQHESYARWDPATGFGPAPGSTASAYESGIHALLSGRQQLYTDIAREAQHKASERSQIVTGIQAFHARYPALAPLNLETQHDVVALYEGLLSSKTNHGLRFAHMPDFTAEQAAVHLAVISTLNQSVGDAAGLGLNAKLQENVKLAGEYVQDNLELLARPDGISSFDSAFLLKNFGFTHEQIKDHELESLVPALGWIPTPLPVLAADVLHHRHPIPSFNSGRREVVKGIVRAVRRFYGYIPHQTNPGALHVVTECLVADTHDFPNATDRVKKGLALRMSRAARQGGIQHASQLPSQRAAATYNMCMEYHRAHRLTDINEKLQNFWPTSKRLLEWLGLET